MIFPAPPSESEPAPVFGAPPAPEAPSGPTQAEAPQAASTEPSVALLGGEVAERFTLLVDDDQEKEERRARAARAMGIVDVEDTVETAPQPVPAAEASVSPVVRSASPYAIAVPKLGGPPVTGLAYPGGYAPAIVARAPGGSVIPVPDTFAPPLPLDATAQLPVFPVADDQPAVFGPGPSLAPGPAAMDAPTFGPPPETDASAALSSVPEPAGRSAKPAKRGGPLVLIVVCILLCALTVGALIFLKVPLPFIGGADAKAKSAADDIAMPRREKANEGAAGAPESPKAPAPATSEKAAPAGE